MYSCMKSLLRASLPCLSAALAIVAPSAQAGPGTDKHAAGSVAAFALKSAMWVL